MEQKLGLERSSGWNKEVNTLSYEKDINGVHMIKAHLFGLF